MKAPGSVIGFLRRRDYTYVKVLGQGACGQTVLLHDEVINGYFVCKKYVPFSEVHRQELFNNFLREIKLLHEVHHQNVVRVFNYYLYPEQLSGYILMEYVEGQDIEERLKKFPESVNELFIQAIEGFSYLESCQVLHRDIRPQNILVRDDGTLKVIDLGFGKRVESTQDFDKSISLNWWCEPPEDFALSMYDHATEVYFVGKLFEKLIFDLGLEHFNYRTLLSHMCLRNPNLRIPTFFDVKTKLNLEQSNDIDFNDQERQAYIEFAEQFSRRIKKIESSAKYNEDLESIKVQLEEIYRSCMLEDYVPDAAVIFRLFFRGVYYYRKTGFPTYVLRDFLHFLRTVSTEKQRIALSNLHSRLDAIQRYKEPGFDELDDDIPF